MIILAKKYRPIIIRLKIELKKAEINFIKTPGANLS